MNDTAASGQEGEGSLVSMDACQRVEVERGAVALEHAVRNTSAIPAGMVGADADMRIIAAGRHANLAVLHANLNVMVAYAIWEEGIFGK